MKLVAIPLYEGGESVYINPEHVTHVLPSGGSCIVCLSSGKTILTREAADKVTRRLTLPKLETDP